MVRSQGELKRFHTVFQRAYGCGILPGHCQEMPHLFQKQVIAFKSWGCINLLPTIKIRLVNSHRTRAVIPV